MRYLELKKSALFFLEILLVVLASSSSTSQLNTFCRQGIFKASKEPMYVNVSKNVSVDSVLECAQVCLAQQTCEVFKHRNVDTDREINCQVTQGEPRYLKMFEIDDAKKKWTVYTLQTTQSQRCIKKDLCNGAGLCLADICGADGFRCVCNEKFTGKYCQYKIYHELGDYDIIFPDTSANNVINIPVTNDTEINEFTLSAWIKVNPGLEKYPLLSYGTESLNETIDLQFTSGERGETISAFTLNILGEKMNTWTIPINDGYWHHIGFSWHRESGVWIFLVDGVLCGTRTLLIKAKIPLGRIFTIGETIDTGLSYYLVGYISRFNLWSTAKNGSEIEEMAKSPGTEDGDLISWLMVREYVSGDLKIIRPSTAAFSGNKTNYDISLPTTIRHLYPGPITSIKQLSTCLWFKGEDKTSFFVYKNEQTFQYRYDSGKVAATINNVTTQRTVAGNHYDWHFLCMKWNGFNGVILYFYDGYTFSGLLQDATMKGELPSEESFILGVNDQAAGTLTQLNIWNYEVDAKSIMAMSAGGFNVHGNILSWSKLANYVTENRREYSEVYLPGFTVLSKRTKWCNDVISNFQCSGQLLARLGGADHRKNMVWRCYCPMSLTAAKITYSFGAETPAYYSKHSQLIAITSK